MSAVGSGAEEVTLRLLYQLIVILLATRLVTAFVRRLGQTDVSGEILAGVLSMLVIMALASTFIATPLIRWLMKGQERGVPALGEPSAARG